MYKLKENYKKFGKYMLTSLDINETYTLETWIKAGFKETILEKV